MAESNNWDVYVIEYARGKNQPWVDLISGMYDDGVMDLPFSFILARRGDRIVLVDTGFMQDEHGPSFSRKFGIPTWISPLRMLAELGVAAEARSPTSSSRHAHFDHMGSIAEFPNARLYIQKSELLSWYEAIALPKRFGYLTAIIDPDNLRTRARGLDRASRDAGRRRQGQRAARHPCRGSAAGHTIGQQFVDHRDGARPAS